MPIYHIISSFFTHNDNRIKGMLNKGLCVLLGALLWAGAPLPAASAEEGSQSIATRTEVGEGEWQAIRLRNLPRGASLRVVLETDGELRVFVVKASEFERLPDAGQPLLAATTGRTLDVALRVPASTDYYLVLDNRQGDKPRQVSVGITGSR